MTKIPKNLTDKVMFKGVKEEQTFETMFFDDEPAAPPKPKVKAKENLTTVFLTPELQEKIGKELLALKLDLYKVGLVDYTIKVVRADKQIILSAVPVKNKTKG